MTKQADIGTTILTLIVFLLPLLAGVMGTSTTSHQATLVNNSAFQRHR